MLVATILQGMGENRGGCGSCHYCGKIATAAEMLSVPIALAGGTVLLLFFRPFDGEGESVGAGLSADASGPAGNPYATGVITSAVQIPISGYGGLLWEAVSSWRLLWQGHFLL